MSLWGHRRSKLFGIAGAAVVLALAGLAALLGHGLRPGPNGGPDPGEPGRTCDRPRLAVLVVFDQMRADYLTRWDGLFDEGGFRRLKKEGAWFENCHLPYAQTFTASGHASLATGCSPMKHGIIGNTWYDRFSSKEIYCVYTDSYELVPLIRGQVKEEVGTWPGAWPGRLQADTLGDALKGATGNKGRVVSLSLKDRSAILLGCRRAPVDACYWFFPSRGRFVTSTYYRPDGQPHSWVAAFDDGRPADQWFGKDWTRLRPDLDYARYSGPDDVAAEDEGWDQGRTFPHPMKGGLDKPGKSFYEALGNSPYGNELLLRLAERAITAEGLGRRDIPDLLCLSFSSNDGIGHCWGPDSQEVLDTTLRSDLIVKELLEYLDAQVGRGRYVLAVTADHGVCPLPEVARGQGKDAGRVPPQLLDEKAEAFLNATFRPEQMKGPWIEAGSDLWIYLNHRMVRNNSLEQTCVEETLADWFRRQPGVQNAYTRTRLSQGPLDDPVGERVRRSFHPERSGDVAVVLKPYHLLGQPRGTGTTHGSPHPYDTHVPLLVYGPGIVPGARREAVTPQAVAAILARRLGIDPPSDAEAPVPDGLDGEPAAAER
jgi:arylsulfatase A-like enzyme